MKTRLLVFPALITCLLIVLSFLTRTEKTAVAQSEVSPAPSPSAMTAEAEAFLQLAQGSLMRTQGTTEIPTVADSYGETLAFAQPNNALALLAEGANYVAYQSDRSGNFDIFVQDTANPSDSGSLKVSAAGNDVTPVWSPDGSKLVFASDRDGDFDIYLWHGAGDVQQLTFNYADDIHPAWSPDGQRIIFSSNRDGFYFQVYTINADGSNLKRIGVVPGNNAMYPRFSPDGSRISFMRASITIPACDWNWDVWVMDSDGNNQVKVTTQLLGDLYPNWSPNGNELIYAKCNFLLASDIYLRSVFTGEDQQLTNTLLSNEWGGVFAKDGQTIAFNGDESGDVDIYLISLNDPDPIPIPLPITKDVNGDDLAVSWNWQDNNTPSISGEILYFSGEPIDNVSLSIGPAAPEQMSNAGSYQFSDLPTGQYTVVPTKPDYIFTPAFRSVEIPPGSFGQNFTGNDCSQADRTLRPLLLVTGWGGSVAQPLSQDSQLKYFIDFDDQDALMGHLSPYGYVEGCNLFYAKNTSPHLFLEDNGKIIRDTLCDYYPTVKQLNSAWNGSFDIIGHSYGGLRARAFLENLDLYDGGASCPGKSYQVYVRNLVTLGTPHGGEIGNLPFAAVIGLGALVDQQWPAVLEMLPPVRLVQNSLSRQPEGTCYYLLSGDGRFQASILPTLLLPVYYKWPTVDLLPNDLAVHEISAHALAFVAWRYPSTGYLFNGDLHGQVPKLVDPLGVLQSYVNPSTTFDNYVRSPLQQPDCQVTSPLRDNQEPLQEIGAASSLAELVAAQSEPKLVTGTPMRDIDAGILVYDEVTTGTFEITAGGATEVTLYWTEGDITFSLTTPGGAPINSQTAGGELLTLDTGFGLMASYQLADAEVGAWSYTISGNNVSEPVGYRLLVTPSEPIAVNSVMPERAANASPVVITATVTYDQNTLVLGGSLVAQILRPDGSLEMIPLFDDGGNQDGVAGDGVFGATYSNTSLGGIYGVQLTATGSYLGGDYERTSTSLFTIAPASADLLDQYSDRGVSNNGLGLFELLELSAEISVVESGTYLISAELYAGDIFIATAVTEHSLTPGVHTVFLYFKGEEIYAAGMNGPFQVKNIVLVEKGEVPLLIEATDAVYITSAYNYEQFGIPESIFLPIIRRN